jgi:hypothetical protein
VAQRSSQGGYWPPPSIRGGGGELATKEPEAVVVAGKALDGLLCTDPSAPP